MMVYLLGLQQHHIRFDDMKINLLHLMELFVLIYSVIDVDGCIQVRFWMVIYRDVI